MTGMKIRIRTKYYGPTDDRGARITARGGGRSATVPYDHSASDPHRIAAEQLAGRLSDAPVNVTQLDDHVYEAVVE